MSERNATKGRTDEITIQFMGPKQFRQELVDAIYKILIEDEMQFLFSKPGCGFTFTSSFPPSDEIVL